MQDDTMFAVNNDELQKSSSALFGDISKKITPPIDVSNYKNMWGIIKDLNFDDFVALRENVYFENLMRSIEVSARSKIISDTSTNPTSQKFTTIDSGERVEELSIPSSFKKDVEGNQDKIELPHPQTLLGEAKLQNNFLKLFKRLKNISLSHPTFKVGRTIGDIISIDASELSRLPSIGSSYVETLTQLKSLYDNVDFSSDKDDDVKLDSVDLSCMRIFYANLSKEQIKAVDKLERHKLIENTAMLLDLDLDLLYSKKGFGRSVVNELSMLKNTLLQEVRKISIGEINFEALEGDFLVPVAPKNLSIEKFGELLLDDIDKYFDGISDIELDTIQKRWGFVENKITLEEISEEHNVTRERIRQIEKSVNERLPRYIRFTKESIWNVLQSALSINLTQKLGSLYSCFNNEKDFYEVLGLLCGQENLEEHVRPPIKPQLLNSYFADNGGPLTYEEVKNYIIECDLDSVRNVDNAIHYLEELDSIRMDGTNIYPSNLRKPEAAAFVLANNPNGLPWLDIAKHVNSGGYSKTDLYLDRPDNAALTDPENIFLAGKGIYKHTRFIDFDLIKVDAIFDEFLNYLDKTNRDVFHLNECYQSSKLLKLQNYYVIRHIVKHFGEDYGFYFDGQSQSDSVGLEEGFSRITQKDVILEAMNTNARPMTSNQIAMLLKSQSVAHASVYLDELMELERVVQVEYRLYTTPDRAYKDIDIPEYLRAIERILIAENKPVEPSVFKEVLNMELSASYSKYLYASIARLSANKMGWYRKGSLYSASPIPYKNLTDVVKQNCHPGQTTDKNITELTLHVAITRDAAAIAINNADP